MTIDWNLSIVDHADQAMEAIRDKDIEKLPLSLGDNQKGLYFVGLNLRKFKEAGIYEETLLKGLLCLK